EHFHLHLCRILCFIQYDERLVQCPSAHIGKRCHLYHTTLDQAVCLFHTENCMKAIVQWTQIGINLLLQITRQKSEILARLYSRPRQYNAFHIVFTQHLTCKYNCQESLSSTGGTNTECQIVLFDIFNIEPLPCCSCPDAFAFYVPCNFLIIEIGKILDCTLPCHHRSRLYITHIDRHTLPDDFQKIDQHILGEFNVLILPAAYSDLIAERMDGDTELLLQISNMPVIGTNQCLCLIKAVYTNDIRHS